jgi:hypothetical protein
MHLTDKGWQECKQDQDDEPRRIGEQADSELKDGEHILCLPEDLGQESSSPGDLTASPLQSVLLITSLELLKIERRRMLHETHTGEVAVALGEEAVDEGARSS